MAQRVRALAAVAEDTSHSQHPHGSLQTSLAVPGNVEPSPGLCRHCMHMIHADKTRVLILSH